MFLAAWTVHRRGTDRTSAKQVYYRMYNHVPFSMLLKETKMSVQMAGEKLTRGERASEKRYTWEAAGATGSFIDWSGMLHSFNKSGINYS